MFYMYDIDKSLDRAIRDIKETTRCRTTIAGTNLYCLHNSFDASFDNAIKAMLFIYLIDVNFDRLLSESYSAPMLELKALSCTNIAYLLGGESNCMKVASLDILRERMEEIVKGKNIKKIDIKNALLDISAGSIFVLIEEYNLRIAMQKMFKLIKKEGLNERKSIWHF